MVYLENERIGARLRQIRREMGADYQDMADVLGISDGHYRKIERGVYGLDVRKVLILYSKLNIDPMFLLLGKKEVSFYYDVEGKIDRHAVVCELLDYCKNQLSDVPDEG